MHNFDIKINLNNIYDKLFLQRFKFIIALLSYLLVYGFEVTHFTLSIDEEFFDNFRQTVSLGRWGHALLRLYLLPEPYVPFFSAILCLIILSFSAVISSSYLKLSKVASYSFIIMLVALPQLAYQIQFENQVDTIALAILFSSISPHVFSSRLKFKRTAFVLLSIFSLSIYQSIFFYGFSLFLASLILKSIRNEIRFREIFIQIFSYILLIVIAIVINAIIAKYISLITDIPQSSYLSAMIGWGKSSFLQTLSLSFLYIKEYVTFNTFYGLNSFSWTSFLLGVMSLKLLIQKHKKALLIISLSIFLFISSFSLIIVFGAWVAPRAMIQLPLIFAALFVIVCEVFNVKRLACFLSLVFLCVGASSSNRLFYSDYMARESDKQMARQIISQIYTQIPDFNINKTPVFFYGAYSPDNEWKIKKSDVFGASFFEWDGGNNIRIHGFFNINNIANFIMVDSAQKKALINAARNIPTWPNRESVQFIDGAVLVKIGNELSSVNL
ncbi:glucosyltransferase domain-containing protein [Atlantibacter subterraneus]|uniref:glucosyltransferase domain-containing protein n=1 Tax=Atlantibacter subterraneus TaxID=255519 RepID=UPI0028A84320|nr:glucosyltransferase domain-containing protein [Atlantibacter subterranea]